MQNTFRLHRNWLFIVFLAMGVAFFVGCNDRRSEGRKPVMVEDDDRSGNSAAGGFFGQGGDRAKSSDIEGYQHVGLKNQFPGGIEPDDYKAQKLVNQLFNYSVGMCSREQECPSDLESAREGLRKHFGVFWPKDPWGNFYQYKKTGAMSCEVWSFGPDGKDATDDDIRVSKSNREDLPK